MYVYANANWEDVIRVEIRFETKTHLAVCEIKDQETQLEGCPY